jgi:hypothetical protein
MTKQIDFNLPHSRQTPTNPSPLNEKTREFWDLRQIDRIPPLLPSEGRKTHSQSHEPHKLWQTAAVTTSNFVSWIAKKSM